jgi:hypothetical protein
MASIKPKNSMNDFIPWDYCNSNCNSYNSYYDLESQTWIKKNPDFVVSIYNDEDNYDYDHHYNSKIVDINKAIGTLKSYIAKFFNYQT